MGMGYPVPPGTTRVPWQDEVIRVCQKNGIAAHLWHEVPAVWQEFYLQSYRAEGKSHKFRPEAKK